MPVVEFKGKFVVDGVDLTPFVNRVDLASLQDPEPFTVPSPISIELRPLTQPDVLRPWDLWSGKPRWIPRVLWRLVSRFRQRKLAASGGVKCLR